MQILAVDDDSSTREIVSRALMRAGHNVLMAAGGREALALVAEIRPDLAIIDVGLPDMDGFEVASRIKVDRQIPIIMLTAHDEEEYVMRGFGLGADDYITKPFSVQVLTARVATIFRRTESTRRLADGQLVKAGSVALDLERHQVWRDGRPISLTLLEFRLLHILAANEGRVISYDRLIEFGWANQGGDRAGLKVRVTSLRKKLGLSLDATSGIVAVTGVGYTLRGL